MGNISALGTFSHNDYFFITKKPLIADLVAGTGLEPVTFGLFLF
jgi:hypothetical protein